MTSPPPRNRFSHEKQRKRGFFIPDSNRRRRRWRRNHPADEWDRLALPSSATAPSSARPGFISLLPRARDAARLFPESTPYGKIALVCLSLALLLIRLFC